MTSPTAEQMAERFWISWHQPTEDFRPLNFPPKQNVLGWWCSGYGGDDTPILCALVEATHEGMAKAVVREDWPEAEKFRFCEPRDNEWRPSDRFPLSDWMEQRLAAKPSP